MATQATMKNKSHQHTKQKNSPKPQRILYCWHLYMEILAMLILNSIGWIRRLFLSRKLWTIFQRYHLKIENMQALCIHLLAPSIRKWETLTWQRKTLKKRLGLVVCKIIPPVQEPPACKWLI